MCPHFRYIFQKILGQWYTIQKHTLHDEKKPYGTEFPTFDKSMDLIGLDYEWQNNVNWNGIQEQSNNKAL